MFPAISRSASAASSPPSREARSRANSSRGHSCTSRPSCSGVGARAQVAFQQQAAGGVEAVEGFVEHDQLGFAEQGEQHAEFLPRAVGHQRDRVVEPGREAQGLGEFEHVRIDRREALRRGVHGEAFARAQQGRQSLGRDGVPELRLRRDRVGDDRMPSDAHRAGSRRQTADADVEQGALAAAVRTEQGQPFAAGETQIDVAQHGALAVAGAQGGDLEHGVAHARLARHASRHHSIGSAIGSSHHALPSRASTANASAMRSPRARSGR